MKKNFFFGMFAATGMLLATSCSNDELIEQTSGDMATVSFAINTEGKAASRAIADGTTAQKLNYAIYHVVNGSRTKVKAEAVTMTDKQYTLECVLAKGQTYELGFWAQAEGAPYTVTSGDDGMTVAIDYSSSVSNNEEKLDAFTAYRSITVNGNATQTVALKRPFAQINVGVTEADYTAASTAHTKIVKSSVELTGTFGNGFNVMTGEATGRQENVTFTRNDIPNYANETLIVNQTSYKYLSTCYVLPVSVSESQTVAAKFTFIPENGNDIVLQNGLSNLPIQSNWRTNIVGDILTSNLNVTVNTDQNFDGDKFEEVTVWDGVTAEEPALSSDGAFYEVSTPAHWAWLAGVVSSRSGNSNTLGKGIKLMANIDFGGHAINPIRPNATITIDGNGKTLSNFSLNCPTQSSYAIGLLSMEMLPEKSTLTIKNLNLDKVTAHNDFINYSSDPKGYAAVLIADVQNGATVNIEGVKVTNSSVKGIQSVGTLVGLLNSGSTVNVKNTTVENNTLTNYEYAKESGYVCGLVGKVAGTLHVESGVAVNNNKIEAYYASERGAKSINEFAAIRADGTISGSIAANDNTITRKPIGVKADLLINTVDDLKDFAADYAKYNDKVVLLNNDLDLAGVDWTPIGGPGAEAGDPFRGTFDGYGNTIKKLTVTEKEGVHEYDAVAFFGWLYGTVKNLNFENAKIKGHHDVAVVVGYLVSGAIENCKVTNAEVEATFLNEKRDGDKAGAIVGYVNDGVVKNCEATYVTVKAVRDAGQLIGCCTNKDIWDNFTDNKAANVTVSGTGANINNNHIGRTEK